MDYRTEFMKLSGPAYPMSSRYLAERGGVNGREREVVTVYRLVGEKKKQIFTYLSDEQSSNLRFHAFQQWRDSQWHDYALFSPSPHYEVLVADLVTGETVASVRTSDSSERKMVLKAWDFLVFDLWDDYRLDDGSFYFPERNRFPNVTEDDQQWLLEWEAGEDSEEAKLATVNPHSLWATNYHRFMNRSGQWGLVSGFPAYGGEMGLALLDLSRVHEGILEQREVFKGLELPSKVALKDGVWMIDDWVEPRLFIPEVTVWDVTANDMANASAVRWPISAPEGPSKAL